MVSDVGVIFMTDGGLHSTLNTRITSSPRWLITFTAMWRATHS